MYNSIGLIGKMGSGKDTLADALVDKRGYTRLAFATPLKQMVIDADPLVRFDHARLQGTSDVMGPMPLHLSDLMEDGYSFELCKRNFSEVRRSLQRIGQGVRRIDPEYWVNNLVTRAQNVEGPIVVTDVRYPNEAEMLSRVGFRLVRVVRDCVGHYDPSVSTHPSETSLDDYPVHTTIHNDRYDVAQFKADVLRYI